jgi:sec-independent protein translocase protein TatA
MFGIGPWEMLLIFLAILLLFGAKRLPEIAQGLGKGIRDFKRAMKDTSDEVKGSVDIKPPAPNHIEPPRKDNNPTAH